MILLACFLGVWIIVPYVNVWDLLFVARFANRDCGWEFWIDGVELTFLSIARFDLILERLSWVCKVGRWWIVGEVKCVWRCFRIINGDIDAEETSVRDCNAYRFIKELFDLTVVVDNDALPVKSDGGGVSNRYSSSSSSSLVSDAKLADGDVRSIARLLFDA